MNSFDEIAAHFGCPLHTLLGREFMVSLIGSPPSPHTIVGFGYAGRDACVCVRGRDSSIVEMAHPSRISLTEPVPPHPHPVAEVVARRAARTVFQKRGNRSEAHLSETELRVIIQAAICVALKGS